MRIAVMGSGGLGGYFGARLARGGADVHFVARGSHLRAMREHGLRIEGPEPMHLAQVAGLSEPARDGQAERAARSAWAYRVRSSGDWSAA